MVFLLRRPEPGYGRFLKGDQRKALRRMRRRLTEQLGEEPYLVDQTYDARALERYLELEASGYKTEYRYALAAHPGEPALLRELCRRFRAEGRLHILGLVGGCQTVAMEIWLRSGEGLFRFKDEL